jgi:hypothetical protein
MGCIFIYLSFILNCVNSNHFVTSNAYKMKIYKSKKDLLITTIIIILGLIVLLLLYLDKDKIPENPIILIPLLIPLILVLWIFFDTYYIIDNQRLMYHSAFLRGEIEIKEIREIVKGKTIWFGIKPALARKGLIIKYNKFDEIYIAPETNDELISALIEINHEIKVI